MITITLCLAAVLIATVITRLVCNARVAKGYIRSADHQELLKQFQLLKTDEGVLKVLYDEASAHRDELEKQAAIHQQSFLTCSQSIATALAEKKALEDNLAATESLLEINRNLLVEAQAANLFHEKKLSRLEAELETKTELLNAQREFVEGIKLEMEQQFRLIANTSLDENGRKLSDQQKEKLEVTLQPFREQIEAFRKQVDEKFTAEVADRNTLKGELTKVFELTNTLTDQTNKLSNALTTHTKTQGSYGEDVLEIILRNAGMIEGEHYRKQFGTLNEDGQRVIPDILLHSPNGFNVVIDSKVSLTHYIRYCNDTLTPDEERILRKEIWQSFKSHIDGLSDKKYESIENCADFVLMFAPVESAFNVAAQHDSDIRNYAFQKKVFLVTPSNLLLVVKMIGDLWQKDRVNREAREMANRAKALYEKATSFLTSFTEVGASLDKAKTQFEKATTQLVGNGGLVRQGELLQKLIGKDTQKVLPAVLISQISEEALDSQPILS